VGKLELWSKVRRELLGKQCGAQFIQLTLLSVRQGRHQAQVIPQGMLLTQGPQTLRPSSEQARRVRHADARQGSFGKSLNLGGI
jgi:hypothetical protein